MTIAKWSGAAKKAYKMVKVDPALAHDCFMCQQSTVIGGGRNGYWCLADQVCHTVGSSFGPCSVESGSNECIGQSHFTACTFDQCPGVTQQDITDACNKCIDHTRLHVHTRYWCTIDNECHE